MRIKVSAGNTKLGKIPSISLPPVTSCAPGIHCVADCYARKAWVQYSQVRAAWQQNWEVYKEDPDEFFDDLGIWLAKKKPRFFRVHVAGDIPDKNYWDRLTQVCRDLPETKFLLFTKRVDLGIDFTTRPGNLSVFLSMWPGVANPLNQEGVNRAWMQDGTETRAPNNALECTGFCENCGACWGLRGDVVFQKH